MSQKNTTSGNSKCRKEVWHFKTKEKDVSIFVFNTLVTSHISISKYYMHIYDNNKIVKYEHTALLDWHI